MDFWGGFLDCVMKNGVTEEHAEWYVNWASKFARSIRGVPLKKRAIEDIRCFLDDLKADENTAPWQVEQARQALRFLYEKYLLIDPARMPKNRTNAARDRVSAPHELEQMHGDLIKELKTALRVRHYSPRTEEAYISWVKRFISFHDMRDPRQLGAEHIRAFLDYLAMERSVASSTQNQALNAVVFLYAQVLERDPGDFSDFTRAKMPQRVPHSLSRDEVFKLLEALDSPHRLIGLLMYGSGLRIMECLNLRIQDIGFDQGTIHVRDGKGAKDRMTMLPDSAVEMLQKQMDAVHTLYDEDICHENGLQWNEQFIFPSRQLMVDAKTRKTFRTHIHHNSVQKALKKAARDAGIPQNVTPHMLRHSFATHLYEDGCHIQTIQDLMGHSRLSTTMIYTHPMNQHGKNPQSPLDSEGWGG